MLILQPMQVHDKGKMKVIENPKDLSGALLLFCWVKGDDPNQTFALRIASTQTIGDLKNAIKGKKQSKFRDVGADTLKIWKVSVSY